VGVLITRKTPPRYGLVPSGATCEIISVRWAGPVRYVILLNPAARLDFNN